MTREKAIELAIKACEETWNEKTCKQIREVLEQEPICIAKVEFDEDKLQEIVKEQVARIEITTEQEPKTGHWTTQWNVAHQKEYYYCSECREEFSYDGETGIKMNDYDYCPNCGARMVEQKESENKE